MHPSFNTADADSGGTRLGRFGTLALALLLVSAGVSPFATGMATAQANVYTQTVTGSPERVGIDLNSVSGGTATIEITVRGGEIPERNADTTIFRRTVDDGQYVTFGNYRAYEQIDVRVELSDTASGDVSIGKGDDFSYVIDNQIGYTGGDANLECDVVESLSFGYSTDCNPLPAQQYDEAALDGAETEAQMTQTAASVYNSNTLAFNRYDNTITQLENDALIEGKLAYVRELENGSTKSVAKQRAVDAVESYWSKRQITLIKQWNASMSQAGYIDEVLANESATTWDVVMERGGSTATDGFVPSWFTTQTETLANGTEYPALRADGAGYLLTINTSDNTDYGYTYSRVLIESDSGVEQVVFNQSRFKSRWNGLEDRSVTTKSEIETFVNNTYAAYDSGEINASDILNAYDARRLGPEDGYETWALAELSRIGLATPGTLENTGSFNITVYDASGNVSRELSGILLSDGLPANDTFEVGPTYNTSALAGPQFVVMDTQTTQIEEGRTFELTSATTKDGTSQTSVQYKNITYESTNLSEFQSTLEQLSLTLAEIEARQQEASGGGGGLPAPDLPQGQLLLLGAGGAVVVLLILNN